MRAEDSVDQQEVLARSDLFVTHHGINSTHEAITHGVPMLSYPFFWDRPGLAVPLADTPRGPIDRATVHRALGRVESSRDEMPAALGRAREWEQAVIARRPAAIQRISPLMA